MTTTDLNEWTYMFSIVRTTREAEIYISNGMGENFRVVCLLRGEIEYEEEANELDWCREVGEDFVMNR